MDDLLQYFISTKEKAYKKEIIALNEGAIESKKIKKLQLWTSFGKFSDWCLKQEII